MSREQLQNNDEEDVQDPSEFDIKHIPNPRNIQKNLYCCQNCHFIQSNRMQNKSTREDSCPNCGETLISKVAFTTPIITIMDAKKSFLGRIILNQTGLDHLIPGIYALNAQFEQNDEKDE